MAQSDYCSSKILIDLQSNLKALSERLNDTYEFLKGNESQLGESWMDDKFSEFDDEFKSALEYNSDIDVRVKPFAVN